MNTKYSPLITNKGKVGCVVTCQWKNQVPWTMDRAILLFLCVMGDLWNWILFSIVISWLILIYRLVLGDFQSSVQIGYMCDTIWPISLIHLCYFQVRTVSLALRTRLRIQTRSGRVLTRAGGWAWRAWLLSSLCPPPAWSLVSQPCLMAAVCGPEDCLCPREPDLDLFWASGSLSRRMMNSPGRWELLGFCHILLFLSFYTLL